MDEGLDISLKHCRSVHVSLPLLLYIRQPLNSSDGITLPTVVEGQKTLENISTQTGGSSDFRNWPYD